MALSLAQDGRARGTQEWRGGPESSGDSAYASGTRVDCHATSCQRYADRAVFRDDGLVAELSKREGAEKLRFRVVHTPGMRVRQTVGEAHSERRHVTPDDCLESPIVALHDVAFVI